MAVGQKAGEIRDEIDADGFAEQFYASLLGLNFQWLVNPEIDLKVSIDTLKQNIVALLGARQAPAGESTSEKETK